MKNIAYVLAALVAAGIAFGIATSSSPEKPTLESVAPAAQLVSTPATEAGSVTLEVPGMHCQYSCFASVQETLSTDGAVSEVVLADQPDPSTLTVKQVIVKYEPGFDVDKALENLHAKGFKQASTLQ